MPQFRYYITDLNEAKIVGTDNDVVAREMAEAGADLGDYFVLDAETGEELTGFSEKEEVQEMTYPEVDRIEDEDLDPPEDY